MCSICEFRAARHVLTEAGAATPLDLAQARRRSVAVLGDVMQSLGVSVSAAPGGALRLRRADGVEALVADTDAVWHACEALLGAAFDPLHI